MADRSKIEWTDATWITATGCTKVSPGCTNCYMYRDYPRLKMMKAKGYEKTPDELSYFPDRLDRPRRWERPRMIFVNSMSDTFHPKIPVQFICDMFKVMLETPRHTYQVLTKRPGRAAAFWLAHRHCMGGTWPFNIWIGTSVESQRYALRVDVLSRIPAETRFVSAEPLLDSLSLAGPLQDGTLSWLIAGGESGPGARPMNLDHVRKLRDEAQEAGVPFFLKQLGGPQDKRGREKAVLDGRTWTEMPEHKTALGV